MKPSQLIVSGMCEGLREMSRRSYRLSSQISNGQLEITEESVYNSNRAALIEGDEVTQNAFQHFMLAYNQSLVEMLYNTLEDEEYHWVDILSEDFIKVVH